QSAREIATAYEQATRKQWTQPIGFVHALFEVAVDGVKRSPGKNEAKAGLAAIPATPHHPLVRPPERDRHDLPPIAQKNIAKTPLVGGQWRLRDGGKYDIVITDNKTAPAIPVGGKMEAIG